MITFGYIIKAYPTPGGGRNKFLEWLKSEFHWKKHDECATRFIQEYFDSTMIKSIEELDVLYKRYLCLYPESTYYIKRDKNLYGYIRDVKLEEFPKSLQPKIHRLNCERSF